MVTSACLVSNCPLFALNHSPAQLGGMCICRLPCTLQTSLVSSPASSTFQLQSFLTIGYNLCLYWSSRFSTFLQSQMASSQNQRARSSAGTGELRDMRISVYKAERQSISRGRKWAASTPNCLGTNNRRDSLINAGDRDALYSQTESRYHCS